MIKAVKCDSEAWPWGNKNKKV